MKKNFTRTFISLPPEQYERLKAEAKEAKMTFSAYVRRVADNPLGDKYIDGRVEALATTLGITKRQAIWAIVYAYFAQQDAHPGQGASPIQALVAKALIQNANLPGETRLRELTDHYKQAQGALAASHAVRPQTQVHQVVGGSPPAPRPQVTPCWSPEED